MKKQYGIIHRTVILLGAVLIIMAASSGMQRAFSDQSLQSRLISWFDDRENESIRKMDQTITAVKNRLMDRLSVELKLETQRAQAQLAQHTATETAISIQALQEYTEAQSANINVSSDAERAAVSSAIQDAMESAKATIQGAAVVPVVPPVSQPVPKPSQESNGEQPGAQATSPADEPSEQPVETPVPAAPSPTDSETSPSPSESGVAGE